MAKKPTPTKKTILKNDGNPSIYPIQGGVVCQAVFRIICSRSWAYYINAAPSTSFVFLFFFSLLFLFIFFSFSLILYSLYLYHSQLYLQMYLQMAEQSRSW